MDLVEVDIVGLQPAQRRLALRNYVAAAVAGGQDIVIVHATVDLGCQHDLVPLAAARERLTDDLLAAAAVVDIGRIEEVNPLIERGVDDGHCLIFWGWKSEIHTAETEDAYLYACAAETAIFHSWLLLLHDLERQL